ncbi:hypothetical protein RCH12_002716 [Cryobacterium sp. MP_3.1]|uniref:hypothetical protein n=1 Tax=Cryobacterium sp. MP_3.1 TaxID=3071711 RepID=UPI002DFB4094|nr:hypothetical protein [Cryobacterium sp. MP_3.1]
MTPQKRECPSCTLQQSWLPEENRFASHFFYGRMDWCSGGKRPTSKEKSDRKSGKRGHSIRAVNGGLPS